MDLDQMSLPELEQLMKNAQATADKKRQTHKRDVRKKVMEMIRAEGLTLADVFPETAPKGPVDLSGPGPIVNPNNPEEVWEGKGRRPKWLVKALREAA